MHAFLPKRLLGQSDIAISPLGLGTVKFGRNQQVKYPHPFTLPSHSTLRRLLAQAQAAGINLIDTAPAYGNSEERLGKLLLGQRHEWVISTKAGEEFTKGQSFFNFSTTAIIRSVERSLKRLKTDYLDIVLIHSNGEDQRIIEQDEVFVTLANLKQAGKIRCYGMSAKTTIGALLTLTHAEVVMITFNILEPQARSIIAQGHRCNKGILIKKALGNGRLSLLSPESNLFDALRFVLNEPGVSSVIVGTIHPLHWQYNIQCVQNIVLT